MTMAYGPVQRFYVISSASAKFLVVRLCHTNFPVLQNAMQLRDRYVIAKEVRES